MKVCVITGGGSGMGLAAAGYMTGGERVIISGRSKAKLEAAVTELKSAGVDAESFVCDTSDREGVRALAERARSLGSVERVINAAGISGSMGTADSIVRINALGTVYVNQEFYRVMEKGCILDVCSNSAYSMPKYLLPKKAYPLALRDEKQFVEKLCKRAALGKKGGMMEQMAYCISKNFVKWYVGQCAYKYALKGIRVFSVSPGFVNTAMTRAENAEPGSSTAIATQVCLNYTGLKRPAESSELGYLFAALTDERNGYLVGVDVLCDGGSISAGFCGRVSGDAGNEPKITENW